MKNTCALKNCVLNRISTLLFYTVLITAIIPRVEAVQVNLSGGPHSVLGIHFDEIVTLPSAANAANYTIYGKTPATSGLAVTVTNAVLQPDNQTVALYLSGFPGEFFAVGVANVVNQFGSNINTTVTGYVGDYPSASIGTSTDPNPVGTTIPAANDFFVLNASGSDLSSSGLNGTNDHCQYVFSQPVGNFETMAQVVRLDNLYPNAKASLMARENLTPGSRSVEIHLTPVISGSNSVVFTARTATNDIASVLGSIPASSVMWLRMTRTNNNFAVYYGTNGFNWTALGSSVPTTWSSTYAGIALTSGTNGQTVSAAFSGFGLNGTRPGDSIAPRLSVAIYQKTNLIAMWPRTPRDYTVQISTNLIGRTSTNGLAEANATVWSFLMLPVFDSSLTGTNAAMPTLGRYMTIPMDLYSNCPTMYVRLAQVYRVIPDPAGVTPGVIFSQGSGSLKSAPAGLSQICGANVVSSTAVAQTNLPVFCPSTPAGKYSYQFTTLPSGSSYQTILTVRHFPYIGDSNCDTMFSAGSGKSQITLTPATTNYGYTFVAAATTTPPSCSPIMVQVNVITNF